MAFIQHNRYLGKYVLEAAPVTCNLHADIYECNIVSNEHMELLAAEPLVQHVKRQVALHHEDELIKVLALCKSAEDVIERYMANWRVTDDTAKPAAVAYLPDKALFMELEKNDPTFHKFRRSYIPGDKEVEVPTGFFDTMEYF